MGREFESLKGCHYNRCYEANQIYTLAEVDAENVVNIWDRACKSGLRLGINIMDKAAVVNGVG